MTMTCPRPSVPPPNPLTEDERAAADLLALVVGLYFNTIGNEAALARLTFRYRQQSAAA